MRKTKFDKIFTLVAVLGMAALLVTACGSNNTPTSSGPGNGTPSTPPTNTPTPAYGYVGVSFQGNSLNIFTSISVFVDANPQAYGMGSNGVCDKRLSVGSHTVLIQINGGCPDGNPGRLYFTNSSNVTSYGSGWTWNLNIQPGVRCYFDITDYNATFSACGSTGMAYSIQTYLQSSSLVNCWQ